MKNLIVTTVALLALPSLCDITDTYSLTMSLQVPQVFDNSGSAGYRKYQTQKITGEVHVTYCEDDGSVVFSFSDLVNHKFKLNGMKVTYEAMPDNTPNWVYIGNNRTGVFKTPCVKFELTCEPSYAKGLTDDSTLVLTCSGKGSSYEAWKGCRVPKTVSGYCTGTLGCGCAEYGHVSPTRLAWFCGPLCSAVSDVAPVYGKFTMKFKKSERECD